MNEVCVLKVHPEAALPKRAHEDDAGLDLYALEEVVLAPNTGAVVRTGIAVALEKGFVGLVADRSSLAKRGLKTLGGIIDAGYRGEIHIVIWNLSLERIILKRFDRIAQLLILPVSTPKVRLVTYLDETARGVKGFGSTGT